MTGAWRIIVRNAACGFLLAPVLASLLAGCLLPKYETQIEYDPQQGAYIHQQGAGAVTGQAFLQKPSGAVVYAAGREVHLFPVTDYSRARMAQIYGDRKFLGVYLTGRQFASTDPKFAEDRRATKADSQGRFEFAGLSAGKYYVETELTWQSNDLLGGGRFYDLVEIAGDDKIELILSGT